MLFNSFAFGIFFTTVFILYWAFFNVHRVKTRNLYLFIVSCVFYGWWDYRFLFLIILSSLIDYLIGNFLYQLNQIETPDKQLKNTIKRKKKYALILSITFNIGVLCFFKYFNFFIDNLTNLLSLFHINFSTPTLNIILPVGISFYTFQTLSYTIDLYKNEIKPAKDWIQFFAFVTFFPQLVAGPIERAQNLLPQFETLKKPNYHVFRKAIVTIAWGYFLKIMIADRLSVYVDSAYSDINKSNGLPILIGTIFFSFQLYFDFYAYSIIAKGTSYLMGFNLIDNFKSPYTLSDSFANFWKRWHISLSSWFKDYVYIPLGGNKKGKRKTYLFLILVFAVSGLWHGSTWNFVIWGFLNALFLIFLDPILIRLSSILKHNITIYKTINRVIIFSFWSFSLIFFRSANFNDALSIISNIGFYNFNSITNFNLNNSELLFTLFLLFIVLSKELIWENRYKKIEETFYRKNQIIRIAFYCLLVLSIIYLGKYGSGNENSFIYFQF